MEETIGEKFNRLKDEWQKGITHISSPSEIMGYSSHLSLIEMGEDIVPFILSEIEENMDTSFLWFFTLKKITGECPVTEEVRKEFSQHKAADCWIEWGKEKGYI